MSFTPDPVAFSVFGLDIRWYAVLICTGILLAGFIGLRRAPAHGISSDDALDIILVSVPVGIVGARLWYVLFNLEYYDSLFDVINIRAGGLAIHGGLIFGSLAAILVCRKKNVILWMFWTSLFRVSLWRRLSGAGEIILIKRRTVLRQIFPGGF